MLKIVNVILKQIAIQIQWTKAQALRDTFFPPLHGNLGKSERFGRFFPRQKILMRFLWD